MAQALLGKDNPMIESLFSNPDYAASKALLDATALRHEALASNIANVETPGYKRVDIAPSFSEAFAAHLQAGGTGSLPQYDTLTEFVSSSLKQLQMAITGKT